MKIFLVVFLPSCAFSFFVFYCLWFYFMELGDLRSSQPEGTWVIDTEHTVTSELIPIFLPCPLKKNKPTFFSAIGMRDNFYGMICTTISTWW